MSSGNVLRVEEFARRVHYKVSTIRKKLHRREISFHRVGRMILIPESEVDRLLRDFHPRIESSDDVGIRMVK